ARVEPPRAPLSTLEVMRRLLRNSIEVWPPATYERPFLRRPFFGRETILVMEPEMIRQVLVEKSDAFEKAEVMRRALEPALGSGLLTAEGARWRWQRRAVAPIFRHERLETFVPPIVKAAERTRARWTAQAGNEIDVASEMMRLTFEIIVATMLSGAGTLDVERVERGVSEYLRSTGWSVLLTLLRVPAWLPHPGSRRSARARAYLRNEMLRLVRERRAAPGPRGDLLALLIDASDPETGQAMTDQELVDNLLTFISAGHETTALALTWTFYLLSLHPAIEARVLDEIARVVPNGAVASEHIEQLVFTRQVLNEAMRLYPPAALITREATRDVTIGTEHIAKGTTVNIPVYAVHRHHALWERPDAFDPDRFAGEPAKARHRFAYLPFGGGPRICIGMAFAQMEAVAILATLLPAAHLTLRHGYVPEPRLRVTLRPAAGMPMRIAVR
ncbi:MAG: hypothetical protein QOD74_1901, partial [Variibacter sp.]|nr:hypothetical protein [Variibacter sp.]